MVMDGLGIALLVGWGFGLVAAGGISPLDAEALAKAATWCRVRPNALRTAKTRAGDEPVEVKMPQTQISTAHYGVLRADESLLDAAMALSLAVVEGLISASTS